MIRNESSCSTSKMHCALYIGLILHWVGLCSPSWSLCIYWGCTWSKKIMGNRFQLHSHPFPSSVLLCFNCFQNGNYVHYGNNWNAILRFISNISTLFFFSTYEYFFLDEKLTSIWNRETKKKYMKLHLC